MQYRSNKAFYTYIRFKIQIRLNNTRSTILKYDNYRTRQKMSTRTKFDTKLDKTDEREQCVSVKI